VICNLCYWCASYFGIDDLESLSASSSHVLDCHVCNSHNTELIPISTDESFRIEYSLTRGMEIEFYKTNKLLLDSNVLTSLKRNVLCPSNFDSVEFCSIYFFIILIACLLLAVQLYGSTISCGPFLNLTSCAERSSSSSSTSDTGTVDNSRSGNSEMTNNSSYFTYRQRS
jgi:hypothetical protein